MFEDHERSLNEWYRWFAEDFVREDRRRLIAMPTADAATFQQHLAWFEMGYEELGFEVTEVVAVFGERLALTRTRLGDPSGFPVEMLSVTQWNEEIDRLQKLVQFGGDDVDGALRELDRLRPGWRRTRPLGNGGAQRRDRLRSGTRTVTASSGGLLPGGVCDTEVLTERGMGVQHESIDR